VLYSAPEMPAALPAEVVKFDEFELDCKRYELLRAGRRVKLEKLPMELLILLIEKNGHLLTRQEIIERLWGKDVFVDTEHGINTAIRKIRKALRDEPEQPRFVLTVTGKGYRFVRQRRNGHPLSASVAMPEVESATRADSTTAASLAGPEISGRWSKEGWKRPAILVPAILSLLVAVIWILVSVRGSQSSRSSVAPRRVVLTVLPFQNLSADPGDEYFSDGLTEEMITQVGGLSPEQLLVIARTTSMTYKHSSKSVQEIGRELGADYVLESSLRRDGDRVRITIQLIRTADQVQVWASSYDRTVSGSIALQEELARAVAARIEVQLSPAYAHRSTRSHSDPSANEAYLRGQYFVNQFTAQGYWKAIDYFHQAIDRDPEFAEAYSGLADSYRWLIVTDAISPSEGGRKMNDAARQSVQLNNSLAESHTALAGALLTFCDWPRAESEFKRANALNPSYPGSHRLYAALLASQKRHREALEEINQAMRLDPLSLPNNAEVVRTMYYARDYDGALAQAQKAMQLDPAYYRIHFWLGRVYAQKGMYQQAVDESERVLKATPDSTLGLTELAYSLAAAGRTAGARTILRTLEERSRSSWVPAYNLAIIHVALKENDEAFRYLQRAYDEQDWALLVLAVEPRLDPLRSDRRFLELCRKLRFPA
jgi:TolB-like protein/DNA-binding winged helix-turn-helix (wHTH) protein/Flp pilus assembly protein TadD